VLIIRRSNCINTVSGIVLSVSDRLVCTPADLHACTPEGMQGKYNWGNTSKASGAASVLNGLSRNEHVA